MVSWELLTPGGILFFDDSAWNARVPAGRGPQSAIDLFLRSHLEGYEILEKGYQIPIVKKGAAELAGSD